MTATSNTTTTTARAVGAGSPTADLAPLQIERRALGASDVRIDIKFCGICHSDIHFARGEWGEIPYPAIPGHEIAGVVAAVGSDVTGFAVGDRVGVGCMVNSCRECENCQAGNEQYCIPGNTQTYGSVDRDGTVTYGGYSDHVVVDQDFVLRIPDGLSLEEAAPLLCAGITTYSPLRHWNAGPGKQVAVVGLGGLGHMAVKFAHAMGAEVTVLSQSLRKQEDGLRLGADHYYATSDDATFDELAHRFDLIINTVSAVIDMGQMPQPRQDGRRVRERRRARRAAARPGVLAAACSAARSPAPGSARSARPRRCSTSAPSTASPRTSRSSPPTRSTRPGSACSRPTCATGS